MQKGLGDGAAQTGGQGDEALMVLFQQLHAAGRTIIFVTHNPDIARYSSRNIVLRDGVIKSDVANTDILSAADALAALPPVADE